MSGTVCNRMIQIGMLFSLLLTNTGCSFFSKNKTMYLISLHELADNDREFTRLSRIVQDPQQNRQVSIHTWPFLDAKRFYQAESLPDGNSSKCGLRLYIDRSGQNNLLQVAAQQQGQPFAVLVDGFLIGVSYFPGNLEDLSSLDLEPLWSAMEVEQISVFTRTNYRYLNQKLGF